MFFEKNIFTTYKEEWTLGLIFIAATVFLCGQYFYAVPHFFQEEGPIYYPHMVENGLKGLTYSRLGNYQLIVNLICYLATFVPSAYASLVTTWISALIALILAIQLGRFCRLYDISFTVAVMLGLMWAFSPYGVDIYYNSTNTHWVMAISMLLVCISPLPKSRAGLSVTYIWVCLGALSGIPAVLIGPFFFIRAYQCKSKHYLIFALIFSLCASFQLYWSFLYYLKYGAEHASNHDRSFALLSLKDFILSLYAQTITAPLFGGEASRRIFEFVNSSDIRQLVSFFAGNGIFLGFLFYVAYTSKQTILVIILSLVWLGVGYIQLFGALGVSEPLFHTTTPFWNRRYFATSGAAFMIICALASVHKTRLISILIMWPTIINMAAFCQKQYIERLGWVGLL